MVPSTGGDSSSSESAKKSTVGFSFVFFALADEEDEGAEEAAEAPVAGGLSQQGARA